MPYRASLTESPAYKATPQHNKTRAMASAQTVSQHCKCTAYFCPFFVPSILENKGVLGNWRRFDDSFFFDRSFVPASAINFFFYDCAKPPPLPPLLTSPSYKRPGALPLLSQRMRQKKF